MKLTPPSVSPLTVLSAPTPPNWASRFSVVAIRFLQMILWNDPQATAVSATELLSGTPRRLVDKK
jgi:hypothetical protein